MISTPAQLLADAQAYLNRGLAGARHFSHDLTDAEGVFVMAVTLELWAAEKKLTRLEIMKTLAAAMVTDAWNPPYRQPHPAADQPAGES